eukprot:2558622-Pleurochrysis_carterae.AAC.1
MTDARSRRMRTTLALCANRRLRVCAVDGAERLDRAAAAVRERGAARAPADAAPRQLESGGRRRAAGRRARRCRRALLGAARRAMSMRSAAANCAASVALSCKTGRCLDSSLKGTVAALSALAVRGEALATTSRKLQKREDDLVLMIHRA